MIQTRGATRTSRTGIRAIVTALTVGLVVGMAGVGAQSSGVTPTVTIAGTTASTIAGVSARSAAAGQPAASSTRLPRVDVTIRGPVPLEEKKAARIALRKNRVTVFRGRIGIELRGQSSLRFPKKPYGFEVRDSEGDNRNVSLLGMPADDDWILYPPYSDKTLMRNVLAFSTARRLGGYASRTRLVELWLNGGYRGVYVLMEKLKLHEDRVDKPEPAQLLEWSSWKKRKGAHFRLPGANVPILFDDPERSELSNKRREAVRRSLVAADTALYRAGFTDPDTGWRRHLDEASVVDFVLLNELFKNQEAFNTSTYLAQGKGEKWTLGPLWDLDLSMGNFHYGPASVLPGPMLAQRDWALRLYADPAFVAAVAARWHELRAGGLRQALLADVSMIAKRLVATGAAAHNFRRWPVLGEVIWPNPPNAANRTTYHSEVRALTAWLKARMAWLDDNIHRLGGQPQAKAGGATR